MEFTGILYGFYSNKSIPEVFKSLEEYSKKISFKFESNSFQEEKSMFFYKNDTMLDHHDNQGYNTEIEGEGCFNIEAKETKLNGIATLFEFEGESNFDPIDINLAFTQVYYYVLTIPNLIEDDMFSQKVHGSLLKILS